jgi:hypothetical protein
MKVSLTNGEIQTLIEEEKYINLETENIANDFKDKVSKPVMHCIHTSRH